MARCKLTVEDLDEKIRKLQERKNALLNGGPSNAQLRAAFLKATTTEFSKLSFAQATGILQAACSREMSEEQMATLQKNGSEILARNLPKKRDEGEPTGSDSQPPVAPPDTLS